MNGWKRVADEAPSKQSWVLTWHQGKLTLAKYIGDGGVHEWLLLPMGSQPFAPYSSHAPRWWRPPLDPPAGEVESDFPVELKGEAIIRWRKSVGDLATDLKAVLRPDEMQRLCSELGTPQAGSKQQPADSPEAQKQGSSGTCSLQPAAGERSEPPLPVSMLLWCPECSERHVDKGEFRTKVHHTHECQFCGHTWRPAVVATLGVQFLFRKENAEPEVSRRAPALARRDPPEPEPSVSFWCPATKGRCERDCVGSRCLRLKEGT